MVFGYFALGTVLVSLASTIVVIRRLPRAPILWTAVVLTALTVACGNLLVWAEVVDFDDHRVLGIGRPLVPIETLAYVVSAVVIIPALWSWLGRWSPSPPSGEPAD